ncbi:MAG: methyltransferase domain-containing protein [Desulfobulbaceae bacterium]|nr:MAG: methyltransferase domain-containing protein [Desulfobulbaceae bacterium]
MSFLVLLLCSIVILYTINRLSYGILKTRYFAKQYWDLNICCGKTDGGGLNADITRHCDKLKNFRLIQDIYNLPFSSNQFQTVICSHTIEHVDDPVSFDRELQRVGATVTYIVPPLWDLAAALNFWEHKWIFLTFRKEHKRLPHHVRLPFSRTLHKYFDQKIAA